MACAASLRLKREGKYALAEPIYVRVLELRRAALGDEHPDTLTSINNMAMLLQAQGKLDAAEPLLFEAASTARRVLGIDHPHAKTFAVNLNTLQRQKMHGLQKDRLLVYTQVCESARWHARLVGSPLLRVCACVCACAGCTLHPLPDRSPPPLPLFAPLARSRRKRQRHASRSCAAAWAMPHQTPRRARRPRHAKELLDTCHCVPAR